MALTMPVFAFGFVLCVVAGGLSLAAIPTVHWMFWETDVKYSYREDIFLDISVGLFQMCSNFNLKQGSGGKCAPVEEESFGSEIKVVQAFTILGLLSVSAGGMCLLVFFWMRKPKDVPTKTLPIASAICIGLSAVLSLISIGVFASKVYAVLRDKAEGGYMSKVVAYSAGLPGGTESESVKLSWSFFVYIGSVFCGILSTILVSIGAKQLPTPPRAHPEQRVPGMLYSPNQGVVTIQAPPMGYGYGQAPTGAPYYIGSHGQLIQMARLPHNNPYYHMGGQMAAAPRVHQEKVQIPSGEPTSTSSNYFMASGGHNTTVSPPMSPETVKITTAGDSS